MFYVKNNVKPNLEYLKNKLIESNKISKNEIFDLCKLKSMLKERFEVVDFTQVRQDASRFVFKNEDLSFYSKELFIQMIEKITQ